MEGFARGGLLPEQVWDGPDRPELRQRLGHPTGAAMPLVWAHAEYLTLLRSVADGQVYDLLPHVAERYTTGKPRTAIEFWKPNRHATQISAGGTLRVQAPQSFRLRWTSDEWQNVHDTPAKANSLGISFVDLPIERLQRAPIRFTFLWTGDGRWEGRDYEVAVVPASS
jgi:glucoamylase